jgi:hypothetical protein
MYIYKTELKNLCTEVRRSLHEQLMFLWEVNREGRSMVEGN